MTKKDQTEWASDRGAVDKDTKAMQDSADWAMSKGHMVALNERAKKSEDALAELFMLVVKEPDEDDVNYTAWVNAFAWAIDNAEVALIACGKLDKEKFQKFIDDRAAKNERP